METIKISGDMSFLNGLALQYADNSNLDNAQEITEIPSDNLTCSPITIVHEFIHYYCRKHSISHEKKKYYEEILSIYAELYTAKILDDEFSFDVTKKSEETRLESINWHYYVHPKEIETLISLVKANPHIMQSVSNRFPWILTEKGFKIEENYRTQLADSYGMGYLFAKYLMLLSLTDKNSVQNKVSDTLKGHIHLSELLKYFNIQCKNKKMYNEVESQIRTLKK